MCLPEDETKVTDEFAPVAEVSGVKRELMLVVVLDCEGLTEEGTKALVDSVVVNDTGAEMLTLTPETDDG